MKFCLKRCCPTLPGMIVYNPTKISKISGLSSDWTVENSRTWTLVFDWNIKFYWVVGPMCQWPSKFPKFETLTQWEKLRRVQQCGLEIADLKNSQDFVDFMDFMHVHTWLLSRAPYMIRKKKKEHRTYLNLGLNFYFIYLFIIYYC